MMVLLLMSPLKKSLPTVISESEIDPELVKYEFDQLCANQKFINAIANVREMTLANIMINQNRSDDQTALIETLQGKLGY